MGGDRQKLEPTADHLVSKSRLDAATIRLTLDSKDDAEDRIKTDGTKQE